MRFKYLRQVCQPLDAPLLIALGVLCVLSLVALYSAGGAQEGLIARQCMRIGVGLALLVAVANVPFTNLVRWSPYFYGVCILLLLIVLMVGSTSKGSQRWLDLGLVRFQPAEVVKLAVPMMVAWILTRATLPPKFWVLTTAVVAAVLPAILVVMQPDLGSGILLTMSGMVVIFIAGVRWRLIVAVGLVLAAAAPVFWNAVLHDYQRSRIITLFNPWSDPLGSGYHTIQSIIAVGSGGVYGKGWLAGTQSRLDFIPERNTDFIFAIFAEEFGFLGALLLLGTYLFLGYRGLLIAFHARTSYARLVASGLAVTFFFYVFVNIGMVVGILPVVGVPLPLLSYGGSSMVTLMLGFGILMSIRYYPYAVKI